MVQSQYPSLYQINTLVWLTELSRDLHRPATLDDIPDVALDRLAEMGFDWVWLLSVWQTSLAGQQVSRSNPEWRKEFAETLPDLQDEDIDEPIDQKLKQFYERLLAVLRHPVVRKGQWHLLECAPAWEGNWTWDCFVAFAWQGGDGERLLVAVNYAPNRSQCYIRLPFTDLGNSRWRIEDLLSDARYDRDGNDLQSVGLYLDIPSWQYHAFTVTRLS
jgi:hypothetical protein